MTAISGNPTGRLETGKSRIWIAIAMGLTLPRVQTVLLLPQLAMFGGDAPDAWLAPWLSDAILGLLIPVVLYALLRSKGLRAWGLLLVYNAVGAFDYSHGLLAQFTDPLPASIASSSLVYGGIGAGMTFQCIALILLFSRDARRAFKVHEEQT
ncbi:MAG: hypothetical protein AAGD10_10555 [Myxococcota bacterium]